MRKLTIDDILDQRAYERERDNFRRHIIEMKRARRVALGPIMTIVFENTDTMRWQVQEMARAERMMRDEQIAHELETYNQIIPDPGELSGTLLLELTSDRELREWLPRLVGIERHVGIVLPDGTTVRGTTSEEDDARLTREETTAAVHFLKFGLTPGDVEMFASGPVHVVVDHPEYDCDVALTEEQHVALLGDLRAGAQVASLAVRIRISRLDPDLPLPARAHPGDAGYDLCAREDARLAPRGGRALIATGFALAIPDGYAGFVQPRSGLALRHGVTCLNTPGLIDAGYRDEIRVLLVNLDPDAPFDVQRGERIAQLVIQQVEMVEWDEVATLDETTRGRGGWGSTGRESAKEG